MKAGREAAAPGIKRARKQSLPGQERETAGASAPRYASQSWRQETKHPRSKGTVSEKKGDGWQITAMMLDGGSLAQELKACRDESLGAGCGKLGTQRGAQLLPTVQHKEQLLLPAGAPREASKQRYLCRLAEVLLGLLLAPAGRGERGGWMREWRLQTYLVLIASAIAKQLTAGRRRRRCRAAERKGCSNRPFPV